VGAQHICLGHQADDQAETVMLRLLRGAGIRGLKAMSICGPGKRLRPMLECTRAELVAYLRSIDAPHVEDGSNLSMRILRNRIRGELIPYLERDFARGFAGRLCELAAEMSEIDDVMSELVADEMGRVASGSGVLDLIRFRTLKPGLAAAVLRAYLAQTVGSLRGLSRTHIAVLRDFCLHGAPNGTIDLPSGWRAQRHYGTLTIAKAKSPAVQPYEFPIRLQGTTVIDEAGICFDARLRSVSEISLPSTKFEALFDADIVQRSASKLLVRSFAPGDRVKPIGTAGTRKVKEVFIDEKIVSASRRTFPIVTLGDSIAWLPGLVRGECALITRDTKKVLQLVAETVSCSKIPPPATV
jgi:tRNA(Ile)-lysidine synthase